jgi:nitrile hydratase beta subunit
MPEVHDLGGRAEYFAPVPHDPDEPAFQQRWEERVFGMVALVQMALNKTPDQFRWETEQLPPKKYLPSYFGRWLAALENEMTRDGYLADGEVDAKLEKRDGKRGRKALPIGRTAISLVVRATSRPTLPSWLLTKVLPHVFGAARPTFRKPAFDIGDVVRVRARSDGHTRQPSYVTGKIGIITAHFGAAAFPDARAVGRREPPQHIYTVAFSGSELWGTRAEPGTEIRIELYEPYLEEA